MATFRIPPVNALGELLIGNNDGEIFFKNIAFVHPQMYVLCLVLSLFAESLKAPCENIYLYLSIEFIDSWPLKKNILVYDFPVWLCSFLLPYIILSDWDVQLK